MRYDIDIQPFGVDVRSQMCGPGFLELMNSMI